MHHQCSLTPIESHILLSAVQTVPGSRHWTDLVYVRTLHQFVTISAFCMTDIVGMTLVLVLDVTRTTRRDAVSEALSAADIG